MKRRSFLMAAAGLAGLTGLHWRYWPEDGLYNECLADNMPDHLQQHPLIQQATAGLDFTRIWDNHVHLIGLGDQVNTLFANPDMLSWQHPLKHIQFRFYMDASCAGEQGQVDNGYMDRLRQLVNDLPAGMKVMLLAFDYFHDERGQRDRKKSFFYTPNDYAASITASDPQRFEWVASVHPYREDSIDRLEAAVAQGARAIKWLPEAMGIDPASPRCIPFYQTMQRLGLPLLSHAGHETAVGTEGSRESANPLVLRNALEQGTKVIVAHCASLGTAADLDKGPGRSEKPCFDLFVRMMKEPQYDGLLTGDISAMLQLNRLDEPIKYLLLKEDWHRRLINGSDYPLPGILPIIPLKQIVRMGLLQQQQADVLSEVRRYNPLWFDLLLKRMLRWQGNGFANNVFETRRHFMQSTG